jgi:prepilin-type processing-associated H-X9-DG protein
MLIYGFLKVNGQYLYRMIWYVGIWGIIVVYNGIQYFMLNFMFGLLSNCCFCDGHTMYG